MFRALLLKEWREQRWKAAFGCVIVMGFTAVGLRSRLFPEDAILATGEIFGAVLMPILVAMGMFATEKMERSHHFLIALPASRWGIVGSKTIVALFVSLVPLLGLALVYETLSTNLFPQRWLLLYTSFCWLAVNVVIWTAALGIGQHTEARVAMVGLAVVSLWLLFVLILNQIPFVWRSGVPLIVVPLGFVALVDMRTNMKSVFLVGHIVYSIIVLYFLLKLMVLHLMNDRRDEA